MSHLFFVLMFTVTIIEAATGASVCGRDGCPEGKAVNLIFA